MFFLCSLRLVFPVLPLLGGEVVPKVGRNFTDVLRGLCHRVGDDSTFEMLAPSEEDEAVGWSGDVVGSLARDFSSAFELARFGDGH